MSIQDRQRVVELEARVAKLEAQFAELVDPQPTPEERMLLDAAADGKQRAARAMLRVPKRG